MDTSFAKVFFPVDALISQVDKHDSNHQVKQSQAQVAVWHSNEFCDSGEYARFVVINEEWKHVADL